jgi:hypothetical protein
LCLGNADSLPDSSSSSSSSSSLSLAAAGAGAGTGAGAAGLDQPPRFWKAARAAGGAEEGATSLSASLASESSSSSSSEAAAGGGGAGGASGFLAPTFLNIILLQGTCEEPRNSVYRTPNSWNTGLCPHMFCNLLNRAANSALNHKCISSWSVDAAIDDVLRPILFAMLALHCVAPLLNVALDAGPQVPMCCSALPHSIVVSLPGTPPVAPPPAPQPRAALSMAVEQPRMRPVALQLQSSPFLLNHSSLHELLSPPLFVDWFVLEAVDLQVVTLAQALVDEELTHVVALVALKLDHRPVLGVLHHTAVAAELLLERLEHLLVVDGGVDALHPRSKKNTES